MTVQHGSGALQGVGVIIPPADVREILEKTATFVGEKPALEAEILKRHEGEPRFSFLKPADPYHAYYKSKVQEVQSAAIQPSPAPLPDEASKAKRIGENGTSNGSASDGKDPSTEPDGAVAEEGKKVANAVTTKDRKAVVSILKTARAKNEAARPEPRDPPPDDIFTVVSANPAPHALALDVMKLAAQFVAKNGHDFLVTLGNKEVRNPLFDFLKPMHPHFIVFQRLVDAYATILKAGQEGEPLLPKLKEQSESKDVLLKDVWYMHDWDCQKAEREHEAEMEESEKLKVAQIDWHDFVVLETIDLNEDEEDLPAPVADAKQLPKILAAAQKAKLEREKNRGDVDMDIDVEPATEGTQPKDSKVVTVNVDSDIPADRIRKGPIKESSEAPSSDAKPSGQAQEATVVLPSGQKVPLSKVEASMRAELLNPSYKDERARAAEKNRLQNLAGGEEIARSLARWEQAHTERGVYNRADLQGALSVLPKPSPAEADAKVLKAAPSGPHLPDASDKGDGDGKAPLSPPSKRARVEAAVDALSKASKKAVASDSNEVADVLASESAPEVLPGLLSAENWLKKQGNSAQVTVKVPTHSNKDWKLQGQEILMSAPLKSTVAKLKAVLARANFTNLPANKQKLQYDKVGFLKDKMTLAYYNLEDGASIVLEVKERGGRKRH